MGKKLLQINDGVKPNTTIDGEPRGSAPGLIKGVHLSILSDINLWGVLPFNREWKGTGKIPLTFQKTVFFKWGVGGMKFW